MATSHFSGPVVSTLGFVNPVYTLATLPAVANYGAGTMIFVSNANAGVGTIAFRGAAAWIDIKTGLAVA